MAVKIVFDMVHTLIKIESYYPTSHPKAQGIQVVDGL